MKVKNKSHISIDPFRNAEKLQNLKNEDVKNRVMKGTQGSQTCQHQKRQRSIISTHQEEAEHYVLRICVAGGKFSTFGDVFAFQPNCHLLLFFPSSHNKPDG